MRSDMMNCRQTDRGAPRGAGRGERGSALLISLMVMVILTLLGIAYLLMAETENQIAINERNASQVLYTAESGARAAVEWFNNPIGGFSLPATADVDRTLRWLDAAPAGGDGTWDTAADGTAGKERYKQTSGLLFQKPYRGNLEDALLGNEDHPDLRITAGAWLDTLNDRLSGTGAGTPADPDPLATFGRITQVDIYAPPILVVNGSRTRHGVATIKVTAQKIRTIGGVDRVVAERTIKAVVNEINYPAAGGPLQSCSSTNWGGDFTVHWGPVSVQTGATLGINLGNVDVKMATGMVHGSGSPTQYFATGAELDTWTGLNAGDDIEDPWSKILVGDAIDNIAAVTSCTNPTGNQPCPDVVTAAWDPNAAHGNLFQNQGAFAACPSFDYALFKNVAQRGGAGIYYYGAFNSATDTWKEGGLGAAVTFKQASDNRAGFFFFDTANGTAPVYDGGNNCTNCTDALSYNSSDKWGSGVDAFIYLNAVSFGTTGAGVIGYSRTYNAPGEPYLDANGDGAYNVGESFVDLTYAVTETGAYNVNGLGGTRDAAGPDITVGDVALHGIMYLGGSFESSGNGKYYGALVAHKVAVTATADMWYNERISLNGWPPPTSPAPKVYISIWEIDNL